MATTTVHAHTWNRDDSTKDKLAVCVLYILYYSDRDGGGGRLVTICLRTINLQRFPSTSLACYKAENKGKKTRLFNRVR